MDSLRGGDPYKRPMKLLAMFQRRYLPALLLSSLLFVPAAFSQEGHPLSGTWSGDWGTASGGERTRMTVVMNWDGKKVTGILNPGPNSVELTDIQLDPVDWTVRIQIPPNSYGRGGSEVTAIGKLEDLGSVHRTITGTWREASDSGDFRLERD